MWTRGQTITSEGSVRNQGKISTKSPWTRGKTIQPEGSKIYNLV